VSYHVPSDLPWIFERAAASVEPRPLLTVADWADGNRMLSSKASGERGRYKTSRTPHLRAIMDDLSVHSPVKRVVVKKPAQGGVTELSLNWIGYVMSEAPGPMLVVVPTLELRKRWVRQRLDPMLAETESLAALIDSNTSRDSGNSEDLKDFPGGMIILGGANSAASLSSMPIRYVVCDELDRFPWEVGGEGDPLSLIDQRTKNFPRRKVLLISTPTVKHASRIDQEYEASDQRRLQLPCPDCGEYQELVWQHADGTLGLVESATTGQVWYACRHCGAGIEEGAKTEMLARHRWVPTHPDRQVRGYHWSGLCAPLGLGSTWREMLDAWKAAQSDETKLKGFYNTELAEVYAEESDGIDDQIIRNRLEAVPEDLPPGLRVAFVDVQGDRLEFSVWHWLDAGEAWVLEHVILPGDTADEATWEQLEPALMEREVELAGVDAGYNTKQVIAWVKPRQWAVAMKGNAGQARPLIEDERKRRQRLRHRRRRGVPQEPIGVDNGKTMLYNALRKEQAGPGYVHFADHPSLDEEYFAQLTAEEQRTRRVRGRVFQEWVKIRARNEALDCAVGAIALRELAELMPRRRRGGAGPRPVETAASQPDSRDLSPAKTSTPARGLNKPSTSANVDSSGQIGSSEWSQRL
jgi:phage terminase large subunit GpA-like protein